MFQQILFVNWKATRFALIPFILAAFGLPLLSVQGVRLTGPGPATISMRGADLIFGVSGWAQFYPALAVAAGSVMALLVWNWDHRGNHVYPLCLPLPRWKYVLYKMGSGGALLLIPVVVLWLGSLLAVSVTDIPEGLRAYPSALAFRFFLATLISFAVVFAMAAGTMRTAIILLIVWILLIFIGETAPPFLGRLFGLQALADFRLLRWLLGAAMSWPGPFEVLAGNWMLIDV